MSSYLDAASDRYLGALADLNTRIDRAQRAVSSGRRVNTASDDPDVLNNLMAVRSSRARLEQTKSNLSRISTEVDTGEQALESAVKLFDRVRTLGTAGANTTQTAETRQSLADELSGILERMTGLADTQVDGRYIFSGDSDQTPAYTLDMTQTPPWNAFAGTPSTRLALHPTGVTFAIAKNAQEIFDNPDPTKNAFAAIENLRQALLANDDAAIQTALQPLANVSSHLNSMLSFYGNVQSQVTEATDTASKMATQLESERAALEDADMTTSITELQQARYQQQIALEVRAKLPKTSLFDYLG